MPLPFLVPALLAPPAPPPGGGRIPDFTLRTLDGSLFRLRDHLGKQVILIDFWATWCGPCLKALRKVQELHETNPDVLVLAITIDDARSMAAVSQVVQGRGYTFTVLLDPEGNVARIHDPALAVPFSMVIGLDGEVAYTHSGFVPGDELAIQKKLDSLRAR